MIRRCHARYGRELSFPLLSGNTSEADSRSATIPTQEKAALCHCDPPPLDSVIPTSPRFLTLRGVVYADNRGVGLTKKSVPVRPKVQALVCCAYEPVLLGPRLRFKVKVGRMLGQTRSCFPKFSTTASATPFSLACQGSPTRERSSLGSYRRRGVDARSSLTLSFRDGELDRCCDDCAIHFSIPRP